MISFAIETDGSRAYKRVVKKSTDKICNITAVATLDGNLTTTQHTTTGKQIGETYSIKLSAHQPRMYHIIGDNIDYLDFTYTLPIPEKAYLSISIEPSTPAPAPVQNVAFPDALMTSTNALRVALENTEITLDISMQDNIIIHGKTIDNKVVPVLVNGLGAICMDGHEHGQREVKTEGGGAQSLITKNSIIYSQPTYLAAGSSSVSIDIGKNIPSTISLLGSSTATTELKIQVSSDNEVYYDSIYTCLIKQPNTNFAVPLSLPFQYIKVVPSTDTSLTLRLERLQA